MLPTDAQKTGDQYVEPWSSSASLLCFFGVFGFPRPTLIPGDVPISHKPSSLGQRLLSDLLSPWMILLELSSLGSWQAAPWLLQPPRHVGVWPQTWALSLLSPSHKHCLDKTPNWGQREASWRFSRRFWFSLWYSSDFSKIKIKSLCHISSQIF